METEIKEYRDMLLEEIEINLLNKFDEVFQKNHRQIIYMVMNLIKNYDNEEYFYITETMAESMNLIPKIEDVEPYKSWYKKDNFHFFASHFSDKAQKTYDSSSMRIYYEALENRRKQYPLYKGRLVKIKKELIK